MWAPVNHTLRQVFPAVHGYNQAVYSFMDEWGWNIAFADGGMGGLLDAETVDSRISQRIKGEQTRSSSSTASRTVGSSPSPRCTARVVLSRDTARLPPCTRVRRRQPRKRPSH